MFLPFSHATFCCVWGARNDANQPTVRLAQTACWNLNKLWENNARIDTNGIRYRVAHQVVHYL